MGHYELEDKREAHKNKGNQGRNQLPKAERPWWRKTDKIDTNLAKYGGNVEIKDGKPVKVDPVSPAGLKYIMEGKKT